MKFTVIWDVMQYSLVDCYYASEEPARAILM
jgi:hypothetical protein